jgi:hypothetical protein
MTAQPATVDSLRTLHAAAQRLRAGCACQAAIHATICATICAKLCATIRATVRAASQAARLQLATPASEARRVAQLNSTGCASASSFVDV